MTPKTSGTWTGRNVERPSRDNEAPVNVTIVSKYLSPLIAWPCQCMLPRVMYPSTCDHGNTDSTTGCRYLPHYMRQHIRIHSCCGVQNRGTCCLFSLRRNHRWRWLCMSAAIAFWSPLSIMHQVFMIRLLYLQRRCWQCKAAVVHGGRSEGPASPRKANAR